MTETPEFIGHRGARFEAPENTLPGFRYAIGIGIHAIEFDVRMTADHELVIIHDESVDRTTNGTGLISQLTVAEIQSLDARSIFPDWPEICIVPTLDQVLDTVASVPDLIIEIKKDTPVRLERIISRVIEEVEARGLTDQVTITSFDPVAVGIVHRLRPAIRHGYIGNWDDPAFIDTSIELGCTQVDAHIPTADPTLVRQGKERGWRVVVWPCNSPDELERALALQPDLICTDRPTEMRALHGALKGA